MLSGCGGLAVRFGVDSSPVRHAGLGSAPAAGAEDPVDSLAPGTVPLSQLVQQLLKNCNRQSMAALRALHDGFGADPQKHGENDKNISISCLRIQIN